jgi:hypothetical protein
MVPFPRWLGEDGTTVDPSKIKVSRTHGGTLKDIDNNVENGRIIIAPVGFPPGPHFTKILPIPFEITPVITKAGLMVKKGGFRKNWCERWVAVSGQGLAYSVRTQEEIHGIPMTVDITKGIIPMSEIGEVRAAEDGAAAGGSEPGGFLLEVATAARTYQFKLLDEVDDRPAWIEAIEQSKAEAVKLKAEQEARAPAERAAALAMRAEERAENQRDQDRRIRAELAGDNDWKKTSTR